MTSGAAFIRFALAHGVLEFGDFELKSGRHSPYFFNLGVICTGAALAELGRFYADAIAASDVEFDVLFGPAYKGIPLASVTATCLHQHHGADKAVAYNRKEMKDHGEGGWLVGAALKGKRVLILDDVMTVGTAVRDALALIKDEGGEAVGVVVSFNRLEKASDAAPATEEIKKEHGLKVVCISDFHDLLACAAAAERTRLEAYFERYGVG